MKTYIMFENSGAADFYALFLVGFTDKSGDPHAIGMFGSGFKLAVVSALRLGIDVIVYLGLDKVTFRKAPRRIKSESIEQLVFVHTAPEGKTIEYETNLTLGYGARDWKKPWGVFREILANCRDADPRGYEVVAGVEPRGRDGFTRVFVEATDDIMEIYRDIDSYFKDERHAIFSCEEGRIYPKHSAGGSTRFYCKGMFVLATQDISLYDLDLTRIPINESRDASKENMTHHVLRLYDMVPLDIKIEVLRFVIENTDSGVQTLEGSLYWTQTSRPHSWVDAFRRAFPDHVVCSFSQIEYQGALRLSRKVVRASRELYRMLGSYGIPTAEKLLRDEQEMRTEVFQPEGLLLKRYEEAFTTIAACLPEVNMLNISFVRLPASDRSVSHITCSRAKGEFQFTEALLQSGAKAIGLALIDALAQTRSASGRCDLNYENELARLVWECVAASSE